MTAVFEPFTGLVSRNSILSANELILRDANGFFTSPVSALKTFLGGDIQGPADNGGSTPLPEEPGNETQIPSLWTLQFVGAMTGEVRIDGTDQSVTLAFAEDMLGIEQVSGLSTILDNYKARLLALESAEPAAPSDLSEIQQTLAAQQTTVDNQGDTLAELALRMLAVENNLGEEQVLNIAQNQRLETLENAESNAPVDLSTINQTLADHTTRLETLENAEPPASADLTEIENRLTALEQVEPTPTDLTALENRVQALEEQTPPQTVDLTPINNSLSELDTRVQALEQAPTGGGDAGQEASQEARLSELSSDLEGAIEQINILTPRVGTLEGHAASHSNAIQDLVPRMVAAEGVNSAQGLAISQSVQDINNVAGRTNALEVLTGQHTAAITGLGTDLTAVEEDLAATQQTVANHADRITALEQTAPSGGGGGNSGTGSSNWTYVNANTVMTAGTAYLIDASGGPIDMTLPATLQPGNGFALKVWSGDVTVLHNGHLIEKVGVGNDLGLSAGDVVSLAAVSSGTVIII